jgi:hypothetical protein
MTPLETLLQIVANQTIDAFEFIPLISDNGPFHPFLLEENNLAIPLPLLLPLIIEIESHLIQNNLHSQISLMLNPDHYKALGMRKRGTYI